jgi:hypothetical protein
MMDKEQLQQEIDAMREKLAAMEAKLKVKEKKYFIPEVGEKYWYIDIWGNVYLDTNHGANDDTNKIEIGNCYETKEDAEKAVAKQKAYIRIVRALRDHENEGCEREICIYFNGSTLKFTPIYVGWLENLGNKDLVSTMDACQWVIDNMQDDLKIYFGE